MTTQVSMVPQEHVNEAWQIAGPMLEKAVALGGGRYHIVDILTACLAGTQSLWMCVKDNEVVGVGTLSIVAYPGGAKVSRIEFIGGKGRDDWFKPLWDSLGEYSADLGCTVMETIARPGVGEYIKKFGGQLQAGFYEYDLAKRMNGHG